MLGMPVVITQRGSIDIELAPASVPEKAYPIPFACVVPGTAAAHITKPPAEAVNVAVPVVDDAVAEVPAPVCVVELRSA